MMKTFVKDYVKLCKDSMGFYKKHWKGCVLMNAVVLAAEFGYFYKDVIKDKIDNKLEERKSKKGETQA